MSKDRKVIVRELSEIISNDSKTTIDKLLIGHLGYAKICAKGPKNTYGRPHTATF